MDLITIFVSTFFIVGIGELGDKTQIATGTSALFYKKEKGIIFFSSILALTFVNGLTIFFVELIPNEHLPIVTKIGGVTMMSYGIYLLLSYNQAKVVLEEIKNIDHKKEIYSIFLTNFFVIFIAELGDKTQIATLNIAIKNQSHLIIVFIASVAALVSVTAVTMWGVTKIPESWIGNIQKIGAVLLIIYGGYMLL